jgi:hypothetical protein
MALPNQHVPKVVKAGVSVFKNEHGYHAETAAGGTVKLPAHVVKFFIDQGVLVP